MLQFRTVCCASSFTSTSHATTRLGAPVTPVAHEHMAGGTVSPASHGSHSSVFAHSIVILGSCPEDNLYIRKTLSTFLTPPRHFAVSLPPARLSHLTTTPIVRRKNKARGRGQFSSPVIKASCWPQLSPSSELQTMMLERHPTVACLCH